MLRSIALLLLVVGTSATDGSAHARLSELGKGLSSALSRIKPADDISNSGRSLLQLDGSFCGVMTVAVSCQYADSCLSTTGCALDGGSCGIDFTQYDSADVVALLANADFAYLGAKGESCGALTATQCAADVTCDFDGACNINEVWLLVWLANKCPTMATLISEELASEGVTQAEVQAEANAAGIAISPEFQAEMDAQGMASSATTLSSAFVAALGAAALALA